jgi:hypothetical protein
MRVKFAPCACSHKGGFQKDLWIEFVEGFSKEPKKPLRLKENLK